MKRSDGNDSLEGRFERNAPPVDARKDWMEVRSRMVEHSRRPARRPLRAATISFAVVIVVVALVVGGVEAFTHLGGRGPTILFGGYTTTVSTSPITTTTSSTQPTSSSTPAAGSSTTQAANTITV